MPRSSETLARIAAALAKAQAELVNPEKSLTATIRTDRRRGGASGASATPRWPAGSTSCARRWASTRSRPCRPPRSTQRPGMVHLTTILAHSSGEWIASDWPVCPIGETARRSAWGRR